MQWILLAYGSALLGGVSDVWMLQVEGPFWMATTAWFASILWLFGFSAFFGNSSVFDPFWSVAPPIYLGWLAWSSGDVSHRGALLLACVTIWGLRLTLNWARGFGGIRHEDWRYQQMRANAGVGWWPLSLVVVHYLPGFVVWLGCLAGVKALESPAPLGALDIVAALICVGATGVEAVADAQLRQARMEKPTEVVQGGLWAWSRHPNYLGEVGFWWGVWLFAVAGSVANAWTLIGPLTITLMVRLASIPLMEKRQSQKPGYSDYQRRVSALLFWPPRH